MKILTLKIGKLLTNCYLIVNDGEAVCFDPAGDTDDIVATLTSLQVRLRQIIITHGHADHIADAMELKRQTGATIYANPADDFLLGAVTDQMAVYLGLREVVTPDQSLREGQVLNLVGLPFNVLSTPGHTPGSCCFFCEAKKVLISGDTLFQGSIGRSDLLGGDPALLNASLNRLKQLPDDTRVYPGHGPATTIGEERVRNRYW